MISNQPTQYFNTYHRLYIAFTDQYVIQSQDPLNLRCPVNNQFPVKKIESVKKENNV
jgi:hypothetical protein